jgi:general stress protein 26
LIKDIKFGMLTHRHSNGLMHSVPLTTQNKSDDEADELFFFISRKGELAKSIPQDGSVNVSYAHPGDDNYVSVSGQGSILEDQAKKDQLFSLISKAWFPGGATDPDLALLKIKIGHVEYWDSKDSKMVQLLKIATAAMTGNPPKNMSEHKEFSL